MCLRDTWILLIQEGKHTIVINKSTPHIVCDDRIIIAGILSFPNHISTIFYNISSISRVFIKYRLSFELNKCVFFMSCVKYVSHDLNTNGNYPTVPKFDLLQNCSLSPQGFFSIIYWLVFFYNRYSP